jgi:DNA-binding response OmpR family regulator
MEQKRCILVVEDEPLVSDVLAEALSERYHAIQVGTAAEAVNRIRAGDCDLVLLDRLLPGGGAADVQLLAEEMHISVVLMSGDPAWNAHAASSGHPFIAKPFSIEDLLHTIETALRARTD